MPSIAQPSLTLQPAAAGVTVTVTYTATFSPVETFLVGQGLVVEERIELFGDDELRAGGGPLHTSPPEVVVPPAGGGAVARTRQLTLPRASLEEDPSVPQYRYIRWGGRLVQVLVGSQPDDDELVARIRLTYAGLQSLTEATTPVVPLPG